MATDQAERALKRKMKRQMAGQGFVDVEIAEAAQAFGVPVPGSDAVVGEDYDSMTNRELRRMAKLQGKTTTQRMTKDELIAVIEG